MCDVSAAQGCLCFVSIKVCNAAVTLFTHSCVFIRVALGLQVLDLSVEVFVNEWFCQCVHTFSLKLMQTITPIHCKKKVVDKTKIISDYLFGNLLLLLKFTSSFWVKIVCTLNFTVYRLKLHSQCRPSSPDTDPHSTLHPVEVIQVLSTTLSNHL